MKVCSLDFETSIGSTLHGATFRDTNNDIHTQIWAYHPDDVNVMHSIDGYKRKLDKGIDLSGVDYLIGHNIGFDLAYIWGDETLKTYILNGGKIWDTQLAEYLLTGQQHCLSSLAELQLKYLNEVTKPSRISSIYKRGVGADKIVGASTRCPRLYRLYNTYCNSDGSTPLKIFKQQYKKAKTEQMLGIIEVYNNYLLGIINMSCTGIKLDVTECEKTLTDLNAQHLDYLEQAYKILASVWTDKKLPPFNMNSPDHKSAVLFGGVIKVDERQCVGRYKNGNPRYKTLPTFVCVKGFQLPRSLTTPTKKEGVYKTDDTTMQKIAEKTARSDIKQYCTLQKKAMMYKKAAKTYCQAFLDRNVGGYLFPNFNNTLTTTSRLSSSEPNLQNVSKRNEFGKILHKLFIAPPGWKCVQIDFSQLEIWVLAWLSGDALLTANLVKGVDLHIVRLQYYTDKTYEELYKLCKVDKDPYWDKQRTYAKTVSYQMAYGAMPKKVAQSTGLELELVEKIYTREAENYPDTAKFATQVRENIITSATYSKATDIPSFNKKGKDGSKVLGNAELLPIFDYSGEVVYNTSELRRVGYWRSPTGKKYHFLDSGRTYKGKVSKDFSFTQPKNYPMQGTASDIQAITTAALLKALLVKSDRIKMINEVHDSKWFYVREDVLKPCLTWLKDTIENVPLLMKQRLGIELPFKFPVDIEVGDNFAEMTKYDFN